VTETREAIADELERLAVEFTQRRDQRAAIGDDDHDSSEDDCEDAGDCHLVAAVSTWTRVTSLLRARAAELRAVAPATEDPAPREPRVWQWNDDVPQDEPDLRFTDALGDLAARTPIGWEWHGINGKPVNSHPFQWAAFDGEYPLTEVVSALPTPGGAK
jgi:hypothetical protein